MSPLGEASWLSSRSPGALCQRRAGDHLTTGFAEWGETSSLVAFASLHGVKTPAVDGVTLPGAVTDRRAGGRCAHWPLWTGVSRRQPAYIHDPRGYRARRLGQGLVLQPIGGLIRGLAVHEDFCFVFS